MPHLNIDITTHLLLALYPVAALFGIEILSRILKIEQWIKYLIQSIISIAFAIAFIIIIDAIGIAIMLFVLVIALFIQLKKARNR